MKDQLIERRKQKGLRDRKDEVSMNTKKEGSVNRKKEIKNEGQRVYEIVATYVKNPKSGFPRREAERA